jgi:hypothetical protein
MQAHGIKLWSMLLVAVTLLSVAHQRVWAHCDSLDGPVARDARAALDKGDPSPVLKWVRKQDEGQIREAFQLALAVRGKGGDAKTLADRYFLETLVRVHRAGEGEAFTGLKPAGSIDPGLAAADEALRAGSAEALAKRLSSAIAEGVQERFKLALARNKTSSQSVDAGRSYVEAYVDYVHFVESVDQLATRGAGHGHHEPEAHAEPHAGE